MTTEWLVATGISMAAISLSVIALVLNYRTSRRQKNQADPMFTFWITDEGNAIFLKNVGSTPAFGLSVKTVKGSIVFWESQIRHIPSGEGTRGDWPKTQDCGGVTIDVSPSDKYVKLFMEPDHNLDEEFLLECKNYNGDSVKSKKRLQDIPSRRP